MKALLALLLAAGCASTSTAYSRAPLGCQAQAMDVVWRVQYGRTDPPPDVWWVPPAAQTCGRVVNGARGFPLASSPTGCAGASSGRDSMDLVDFHGGWQATGLAHEGIHIALVRDGQDPDGRHLRPELWGPGGVLARAEAALAAAKLCGP